MSGLILLLVSVIGILVSMALFFMQSRSRGELLVLFGGVFLIVAIAGGSFLVSPRSAVTASIDGAGSQDPIPTTAMTPASTATSEPTPPVLTLEPAAATATPAAEITAVTPTTQLPSPTPARATRTASPSPRPTATVRPSPAATATTESTEITVEVTVETARLRSSPEEGENIVGSAALGETLIVRGVRGDWYLVELATQQAGQPSGPLWVSRSIVTEPSAPPPEA